MSKRSRTAIPEPAFGGEPAIPEVAAVDPVSHPAIDLPPIVRGEGRSVGVQRVRRGNEAEGALTPRKIDAFTAAEACELFGRAGKGGGAAFARWVTAKGLKAGIRLAAAAWRELLEEFAARPLHGHRRQSTGGNHRPNRQHLR